MLVANLVTLFAMELVTPAMELVITVVMVHKGVVFARVGVICSMLLTPRLLVVMLQGISIPDKY